MAESLSSHDWFDPDKAFSDIWGPDDGAKEEWDLLSPDEQAALIESIKSTVSPDEQDEQAAS